jgi:hypothetical protein
MPSSPTQASEAAGQTCSPPPCQFDPDDKPGLLDFDCSDTSSQEASVEVLDDPADQGTQSGTKDIKDEAADGLESDVDGICQGVQRA